MLSIRYKKYIYMYVYIYMCVFAVVNLDALVQASDVRIQRRQFEFFWWDQDSNPCVCETHSPAD